MFTQMNALMVWAGIGLVGFGFGALMVALQVRPPREARRPDTPTAVVARLQTRDSMATTGREMAAH